MDRAMLEGHLRMTEREISEIENLMASALTVSAMINTYETDYTRFDTAVILTNAQMLHDNRLKLIEKKQLIEKLRKELHG